MLNDLQRKFAEILLLTIKNRQVYITYKDLCERARTTKPPRYIGADLGAVSGLCHELGLPFITAKVIHGDDSTPGKGFFELIDSYGIDRGGSTEGMLFQQEIKKILECKQWHRLSDALDLDIKFGEE